MLSNYWKKEVIEATFGIASLPAQTSIYIRLYTDSVDADGVGTEVAVGSYTALLTAPADWTFTAPNLSQNVNPLDFIQATAGWGTIVSSALYDSTNTNMILFDDLQTPQAVNSGNVARFQINELRYTWT